MRSARPCWLFVLAAACGEGDRAPPGPDASVDASPACVDPDQDGFGEGAGCLGEDCREDDASLHQCVCDTEGIGTGCTCEGVVEPIACFDGDPAVADVGTCQFGLRRCTNGRWSACADQVLPQTERCDSVDNDCDGLIDEGLRDACGGCNDDCTGWTFGAGGEPFAPEDPGLTTTADGSLVLSAGATEGSLWLDFENSHACTSWFVAAVLAHVPMDGRLSFLARGERDELWTPILTIPPEQPPSEDLRNTRTFALRIRLTASPDRTSPVVESVTVVLMEPYCS